MAFVAAAGLSLAAEQTWTGIISDTMCAKSHQSNIEHARENSGKTMTEQECTVGCVTRRGQKYVLVSAGQIYEIENQEYAGLRSRSCCAKSDKPDGLSRAKASTLPKRVANRSVHRNSSRLPP